MNPRISIPGALLGMAIGAVGVITFVRGQNRPRDENASNKHSLEHRGLRLELTRQAAADPAELVESGASLAGIWSWGAGSAGTITCGALLQQGFPLTGVVSLAATANDNELLWTDTDEDGTCVLRLLSQGESALLAPGQSCTSGQMRMIPTALTIRRTGAHRLQVSGAGAIATPQLGARGVPCTYQVSATLLLQR